jgi:eukaryotic-like serine/threonine-protein kinase
MTEPTTPAPDRVRAERLVRLFAEAADMAAADREALLHRECGDDPELREDVNLLLLHRDACEQDRDPAFLRHPIALEPTLPPALRPGDRLGGRYMIESQIAEGGMGVVYLATQEAPVTRRVALKVIRADMRQRYARLRFELERQTLALMSHPNIAALFDAGITDDNQPYFIMEYVEGQQLAECARAKGMGVDARLDLFLDVCDAVRHAHQKGILHRDLKPSNILVDTSSGSPRVKVIDFGIARAIGDGAPGRQGITVTRMFVGTPTYTSPEQIDRPSDVDTRSDVYGLGAILYELLAGAPPYDPARLAAASLSELLRIVRDEEPAPPSMVARSAAEATRLRGDLDWITLKALAKDRDRRYDSVAALADDIKRHRRNEPVLAGPPSFLYRLGKFVRRRRGAVAAALVVVTALVAGGGVALWQARVALTEAEIATEVTAFLQDTYRAADPANARGENVTIKDALDRTAPMLERRFDHRPLVLASLHWAIGGTYSAIGERGSAELHLRRACQLFEEHRGPHHANTLQSLSDLAFALKQAGQLDEAENIARKQLAVATRRQGSQGEQTLALTTTLGSILFDRNEHEESGRLFQRAHQGYLELFGERHPDTLMAAINLAASMMNSGRPQDAEPIFARAISREEELHGTDHPRTLSTVNNLATALARQGRFSEAIPYAQRAYDDSVRILGAHHESSLARGRNLVVNLLSVQRFDDGQRIARALFAAARSHRTPEHSSTIASVEILVTALGLDKKFDEAEAIAQAFFADVERSVGPVNPSTARAAQLLVELYDEWGKTEEKSQWSERASRARSASP